MRHQGSYAALIALLTVCLLSAVSLVPVRTYADESTSDEYSAMMVSAGSGIMEFGHAEVGYFLNRRISIEAQYKWAFFDHLVGLGATGYYTGWARPDGPPEFSLVAGGSLLVNPTLETIRLSSTDETLGSAAVIYHGWSWNAPDGFMVRILGGGVIFENEGLEATGMVNVGAGYIF